MRCVNFLSSRGFDCPVYTNPADYFLSVLKSEPDKFSKFETETSDIQIDTHRESTIPNANFLRQVLLQIKRYSHQVSRDPYTSRYRLLQNFVLSFVYGSFFWQLGSNSDPAGAIFYIIMYQGIIFAFMSAITSFPSETALIMREQLSMKYNLGALMIGKTIVETPLILACTCVFTTITNFMIDLNDNAQDFFVYLFVSFLLSLVGQSYGYLVAAMFESREVINAVTPTMIPFIIMGGYFTVDIPVGAIWMWELSYVRWTFQALVKTIARDQAILDKYKIEDNVVWKAIIILVSQFLILRILITLALYRRVWWSNQTQE